MHRFLIRRIPSRVRTGSLLVIPLLVVASELLLPSCGTES